MFSDLVHIELIRLTRSRFFLGGIFAMLAVFIFLNVISPSYLSAVYTSYDIMVDADGESMFAVQNTLFAMNTGLVCFFGSLNVVFATCDYYKYREFINIRGSVRSRAKLCLSEMAGILIQAFVLTLIPVLGTFATLSYDGASIVLTYPLAALLIYVTSAWNVFNNTIIYYALSKLLRRKTPLLIALPVIWIGSNVVLSYASGAMNMILGEIGKELTQVFANPTQSISDIILTSDWALGAGVAVGLGLLQTAILGGVAILFSLRRENI